MAGADYYRCDVCDAKTVYDSGVEWDTEDVGEVKIICSECAKEYQIVIVEKNERGE